MQQQDGRLVLDRLLRLFAEAVCWPSAVSANGVIKVREREKERVNERVNESESRQQLSQVRVVQETERAD